MFGSASDVSMHKFGFIMGFYGRYFEIWKKKFEKKKSDMPIKRELTRNCSVALTIYGYNFYCKVYIFRHSFWLQMCETSLNLPIIYGYFVLFRKVSRSTRI